MNVADVTILVDEIHQILLETEPSEEELIDLAARHEEVTAEATRRLKEVEALLNKGLRPEAIDLAEKAPNLNDIVTALDFPEVEIWNETLNQYGIQPIRELPVDIASELNDAYSVSGSLEALLKRYRTQSLARAPVAERIVTLRRLAVEDKANVQWHTDVEKFEVHRLGQIKQDLQAAMKAADVNSIADIDTELASTDWMVKVPPPLKKMAREAHRKYRVKNALAELKPLAHQLSDAYGDFDQAKATPLRNRFHALADIANLPATDSLYDIASPAIEWLKEEEDKAAADADYSAGVSQIESALETKTTVEELERLYHQTIRHGHTLPERLENRIAERTRSLQKESSRRQATLLTLIVAACLVGCVGIVFIVQTVNFQKAVSGHVAQLTELLRSSRSTGDLQAVDAYLTSIKDEDARFVEQPEILGLKEQLEGIRKEEASRHQQLDDLIADALKLGAQQPRWEDFPAARKLLSDAEALTRNGSDKARLSNARSQIQDAETALQASVDSTFEQSMAEVINLIDQLPRDSVGPYSAVELRIKELAGRRNVSAGLKTTLTSLEAKVQQEKSMVAVNLDVARKLQKITQAVGSPVAYRQALIDYTKVEPGTTRTSQFQEVIQADLGAWESVGKWNSLRERIRSADFIKVPSAEAGTLLADVDAFQQRSPAYPGETGIAGRLEVLKSIRDRAGSASGSSGQQVNDLFVPRTISQAFLLNTTDERYFAATEPKVNGSSIKFKYYTTTTGTLTEDKTFGISRVPGAETITPAQWISPQTKLAKKLRPELATRINTNFEDAIAYGVEVILQSKKVDPILRFLLVDKLMKIGAEGSSPIRKLAAAHINKMSAVGVSRLTNWVAPQDERAVEERVKATAFMDDFGDAIVADLKNAVSELQIVQNQSVGPAMVCVGWLHRNVDTNWVVSLKDEIKVTEPTTLYALGKTTGDKPELYPVLTLQSSAIGTVVADQVTEGKEGHLVYRQRIDAVSVSSNGP